MSHEVRTPLTSIVGYADLLRRRGEGVIDTAPAIDAIARNAQHLLEVVNDVLDISKIEAGMMTIDCCAVDPTDVLADVISLAEPRAKEKSLPLKVSFISPTPTSIEIDPVRIRQVLLNLIYNAIKFTDSGQIGVDVSACPKDRSLTVVVRDTGPGMTPEQIVKISKFEAFCQADNSTTRRFGGTGLGLSIAHTLVNMLDGELSVESAIGKGSSFTITLHTSHTSKVATWRSAAKARSVLMSSVQHRHATTTNSDDALVTELSECRILLAEDSPDSQRLIALHLHRAGAEVDLASDGNEVFSLALDSTNADVSPYSVVLMDVDMPGIDGYEATKRLRDHGYDRPIIILSAHALSDSRSRGYQAGADDYLTKPIDPTRLIDACSRWATVER
ncbi:MAG: response regulator [Phycisphaera sp.]|nr:MAG: response regulator [Phycisphaera sp.]